MESPTFQLGSFLKGKIDKMNTISARKYMPASKKRTNKLLITKHDMLSSFEKANELEKDTKSFVGFFQNADKANDSEKEKLNNLFKKYKIKRQPSSLNSTTFLNALKTSKNSSFAELKEDYEVRTENSLFEQPQDAIRELYVNKQIVKTVRSMMNFKSIKALKEKIKNTEHIISRQAKMPPILIQPLPEIEASSKNQNKGYKEEEFAMMVMRKKIAQFDVEFEATFIKMSSARPNSRILHKMCVVNRRVYVLMGLSINVLDDIWMGKFEEEEIIWKIETPSVYGEPESRYGFSIAQHNGLFFIFGGFAPNKCRPDNVLCFDSQKKNLFIKRTNNLAISPWRRNHVAIMVGTHMFIHGGVNRNEKVISESVYLDIIGAKWSYCILDNELPKRRDHCAALVMTESNITETNNLYESAEISNKLAKKGISKQGIYLFGGVDDKGKVHGDLMFLRTGRYPIEVIKIHGKGTKPTPLKGSSMNYADKLNCLIICGGQTDVEYLPTSSFFFFNLDTREWREMNLKGVKVPQFHYHDSVIVGSKLLVFGGINNNLYSGTSCLAISLS